MKIINERVIDRKTGEPAAAVPWEMDFVWVTFKVFDTIGKMLRAGPEFIGNGAVFPPSGKGVRGKGKFKKDVRTKNQIGFLPVFAYLIRAWVQSKNAARQKSTGINGARSCV